MQANQKEIRAAKATENPERAARAVHRWPTPTGYSRRPDGSFSPILIHKHERCYTGFDDKIIAMYAGGMTVREIRAFLSELHETDASPGFFSSNRRFMA